MKLKNLRSYKISNFKLQYSSLLMLKQDVLVKLKNLRSYKISIVFLTFYVFLFHPTNLFNYIYDIFLILIIYI